MKAEFAKPRVVVIVGPTASGKTELAIRLAGECAGEVVNADSMQVYRGMNIGTAKPSEADRQRVRHHLLDIVDPDVNFSASDFRREASIAISEITRRGRCPIIVGGTGLYLKALLQGLVDSPSGDESIREDLRRKALDIGNEGLLQMLALHDPVTASRLHPNNQVRIIRALEVYMQTGRPISLFRQEHRFENSTYDSLKLGIQVNREDLYSRIESRVEAMVKAGLEDEVRKLLAAGFRPEMKSMRAIGYKEMCAYIYGNCSFEEAVRLIKRNTRHYAKRQLTWFAPDTEINWLEYPVFFGNIRNRVIEFFAKGEAHGKSPV